MRPTVGRDAELDLVDRFLDPAGPRSMTWQDRCAISKTSGVPRTPKGSHNSSIPKLEALLAYPADVDMFALLSTSHAFLAQPVHVEPAARVPLIE